MEDIPMPKTEEFTTHTFTQSEQLPKKNNLLVKILLAMIIIGLGAAGYLFYQNIQLQKLLVSPAISENPIISPTPDPTANWKIYSSQQYSFTFKYPSNHKMEESSGYISVLSPLLPTVEKGYALKDGELKIEIYIQPSLVNDSLEKYVNEKKAQTKENLPESQILEETETNVDGERAILIEWKAVGTGETRYLIKNGQRISIIKYPLETSRQAEFDQILSTFTFIPTTTKYTCPETEWVDCMPSVGGGGKPQCEKEFLSWASENCPGFKGAAY